MDGRGAIVSGFIETCCMSGGRIGVSRIKVGSGCLKIVVMAPGSVSVRSVTVVRVLLVILVPLSSSDVFKGAGRDDRMSRTVRMGGLSSL